MSSIFKNPLARGLKVIIISDGTGETASNIVRAIMTQFKNSDAFFTRYKNVRTVERINAIFNEAAIHHDLIVYTIVKKDLRARILELTSERGVQAIDILGPALSEFERYFDQKPSSRPGLLHAVDDNYFKRVAAMEFTLNNDDGKNIRSLDIADVILVGVSRTSKTPLSVYLSQLGIKVVNIPLIPGSEIPPELFKVDQRKIFALTIDPQALTEIRQKRLKALGAEGHRGNYAELQDIFQEVEWASQVFKENKRWPVFDVTNKAIEETAAEILKVLKMRTSNLFKQSKR